MTCRCLLVKKHLSREQNMHSMHTAVCFCVSITLYHVVLFCSLLRLHRPATNGHAKLIENGKNPKNRAPKARGKKNKNWKGHKPQKPIETSAIHNKPRVTWSQKRDKDRIQSSTPSLYTTPFSPRYCQTSKLVAKLKPVCFTGKHADYMLDFNKQANSVLCLAKAVQICKLALLDLTNNICKYRVWVVTDVTCFLERRQRPTKLKPHKASKDRIHWSIASSLHNSAKLVCAYDIARRANLSQS